MSKFDFHPDPSWLEALEPLDNIYLLASYWGNILHDKESEITVAKISRITQTLIVLTEGSKFRRSNGLQVGAIAKGKNPARIFPFTTENIQALAEYHLRKKLIAQIEETNFCSLSTTKLESIVGLIN